MAESLDGFEDRCRGFLIGTAVGDAMGVPLEGRPPCEGIAPDTFWDGFLPLPDDASEAPGLTSDDTQLVALTMLAFESDGGFDPATLAHSMCRAFKRGENRGWGLGTYLAIARIVHEGATWRTCACGDGDAGNGPAMRAGPIGIWPWESPEEMVRAAVAAARITHLDGRSSGGAVAVAAAHRYLLEAEGFSRSEFVDAVCDAAAAQSSVLAVKLSSSFEGDNVSSVLADLSRLGPGPVDPRTRRSGISGYVVPSVAAALWLFARSPDDPQESLGRAMLAGGDTDTVGSIIGGLTGTLNGYGIWPDRFATNVRNHGNLLRIADAFADACRRFAGSAAPRGDAAPAEITTGLDRHGDRREEASVQKRKVVVYSMTHCPMCAGVKEFLKERGIEFTERNVEDDKEARAEFDTYGFRGTPLTVIDGEPVLGFERAKLEELLGS